jgi:hypothetical protein
MQSIRVKHYEKLIALSEKISDVYQKTKISFGKIESVETFYTIAIELNENFILNKRKLDLIFDAAEGHEYMIRINTWDKMEIIFFYDSE